MTDPADRAKRTAERIYSLPWMVGVDTVVKIITEEYAELEHELCKLREDRPDWQRRRLWINRIVELEAKNAQLEADLDSQARIHAWK